MSQLDHAAGKIYWANFDASTIRVANLDGLGVAATLFAEPPGSGPSGLVIDRAAGKIYWTNQFTNQVRTANLDGSGTASTLFGGADAGNQPVGLAIDSAAGKVYWAALGSSQIRVGNLDGSGVPSTLFAGEGGPAGVALDATAGKLYWATFYGGAIRTGNLDGSGSPATVLSGEGLPNLPALLQAPQPNGEAPAISGGASLGDALSCSPGGWKSDLDGASLFRSPRTFAYAWQLDGSEIPGATTSSFTYTEPGDYTCRVTAANETGSSSQTSAAFTVTLLDVVKYYDKNTNGQLDPSESPIAGWKVQVGSTAYSTPKSLKVDSGRLSGHRSEPDADQLATHHCRFRSGVGRRRRPDDRSVRERLRRRRGRSGKGLLEEQERSGPVRAGRPRVDGQPQPAQRERLDLRPE